MDILAKSAQGQSVAITKERFDMALDRLTSADWEQFEKVASAFLVSEHPSLRTMASPSGDGGRDSELFSDAGEPTTAMQYSVTEDWTSKIRKTIARLNDTFPKITVLVYLTNQIIGAKGDDLRKEVRLSGKHLDIRDRSWFLDRIHMDRNREQTAEGLARRFVDPLLPSREVDKSLIAGLDDEEAKTALLFLEMQVQDTDRSFGLTKASFDTLTLAALRDTNTSKRLSKAQIYDRVQHFLPTHDHAQIKMKVNASLERLGQKQIRHRKDNDEFHLLDSEIERVTSSIARIDKLRRDFEADLIDVLDASSGVTVSDKDAFVEAARRVLEIYFLRKGADFAQAVVTATPHQVDEVTLKTIAIEVANKNIGVKGRPPVDILLSVINSLIATSSEATSAYLRLLLESYTLFAFLAATPDVQRATRNMFGTGEIWLDTSVLLPLIAETAMPETARPFTEMFKQVRKAGLKLYATQGVFEEVERHINLSLVHTRSQSWHGQVPFLYLAYIVAGKSKLGFASWIENFVGENDPVQDIADYLRGQHGIQLESAEMHDAVPQDLADAIRHAWQEVHTERRSSNDAQALRMASHDSEMYLHVLSSRITQRGKAPLGYTDWWLTLDSKARTLMDRVPAALRPSVNIGPVLSVDFLIRYLAFGPSRDRTDVIGTALSKVYADTLIEPIPEELMALVTSLREKNAELPEHVVQRKIRDTLNRERSRSGVFDGGQTVVNPADLLDIVY
jgi:hypothetical protein